jgi:hypothetical protein
LALSWDRAVRYRASRSSTGRGIVEALRLYPVLKFKSNGFVETLRSPCARIGAG